MSKRFFVLTDDCKNIRYLSLKFITYKKQDREEIKEYFEKDIQGDPYSSNDTELKQQQADVVKHVYQYVPVASEHNLDWLNDKYGTVVEAETLIGIKNDRYFLS